MCRGIRQIDSANSIRRPPRRSNTNDPIAMPMMSVVPPIATPPHSAMLAASMSEVSAIHAHQSGAALRAIAPSITTACAIALSAAPLWWAWIALTSDIEAASLALWGGVAIGGVTLILGIAIGSAVFERRGGRLMEFAESI